MRLHLLNLRKCIIGLDFFKFQSGATAFESTKKERCMLLLFKFQSGATALRVQPVVVAAATSFKFQSGATALISKKQTRIT